jgi:hypothetical protein
MPTRPGKLRAASSAAASSIAPAMMQPSCAPLSRSMRVNFRVSISAIATTFSRFRYSSSVHAARQFDDAIGRSRITSPAAWMRSASTSSELAP